MKKAAVEITVQKDELNKTAGIIPPVLPKNFRQQADIEAFYRFVYENDLRLEALDIIRSVRAEKLVAKTAKARVKH